MNERRCVLWTPQLAVRDTPPQEREQAPRREANSIGVGDVGKVDPSIKSVDQEELEADVVPPASPGCACKTANFICIKPEWSLAEVEKAYRHLIFEGEEPEEIMLDVEGKHFRQFVRAAEVGVGFFEQAAAKGEIAVTLGEMIDQAGCGEWLTERDVERVLAWVAKRALEMDVETGWDVPRGYKGLVLNLDQLKERTVQGYNGPSAPDIGLRDLSMSTGIGSTIDQPISLSESDEDDNEVFRPTPPKRPCSNEANGFESPTKKQRVTKAAPLHRNRVVPDLTPTPTSTPTPTPAAKPNVSGRREGSPPPRRTRWTAAQQLAMVSKVYQAGYEGAGYEMIARKVNAANPTGPAKTRQRVKSAMRETHWTNFVNNNDGDLINQLTLNMPDMTGPPVSKTSWTGPQKVIVWAETFGCGEKRVSWDDVAEAVNTAVRGDESLYRKSKDCEKTWRDTMRRHFGLQGRRR